MLTVFAAVIVSLFLLLLIANSIIAHFVKPRLVSYLKESVRRTSDSLYTLDFDHVRLNLIRGSADISNIYLRPDTALYTTLRHRGAGPPLLYDLHSEQLEIRGVNLFKLWRRDRLDIGLIRIDRPEIGLLKHALPHDTVARPFNFEPYQLIAPVLASLRIGLVQIGDGKLHYKKEGNGNELELRFNSFNLEVDDLYIDSLSSRDTTNSFYSEDLRLSIRDFKFRFPDSMYNLHLGTIALSSREARLSIDSLWLEPRHEEMEFHRILDKEADHVQLKTGEIVATGFDIRSFLRNEDLRAREISVENAELIDFLYNFKVDDRPYQQLPHLVLKNSGITVDIGKLVIRNSVAVYRERMAGHSETGNVEFRNLGGVITNITNVPAKIRENPVLHADLETSLMDVGLLKVAFDFHMDRADGYFTVNGSLGRMPMEAVNPMLEATARLKIKRGTLQKLQFTFHGDSTRSRGTMKFYYNNLNIELLGKEDSESNMKMASTLTNLLLLNSNNPPPEGPLREGLISFTRLKTKSIFNYLWKSLLTGFKSSVGISAEKETQLREMAEMFKERKQRREQRREARQERRAERKAERKANQ